MFFDLSAASDQCANWAARSKVVRAGARNPIITAFVVVVIVYAILYVLAGDQLRGAPWQTFARGALYSLAAVSVVMLVHNYVVKCDWGERVRAADTARILNDIDANLGAVPVVVRGSAERAPYSAPSAAAEALLPGGSFPALAPREFQSIEPIPVPTVAAM